MLANVMPGRSGVTAPITPDNRTTGTTAMPLRSRAGSSAVNLSPKRGSVPWSTLCSSMPLPRINHFLSRWCHWDEWNVFCFAPVVAATGEAENGMKIYLLMLLIGTLLTAIRFTSIPEQRSKTLQR
jgi:hypothetical protein